MQDQNWPSGAFSHSHPRTACRHRLPSSVSVQKLVEPVCEPVKCRMTTLRWPPRRSTSRPTGLGTKDTASPHQRSIARWATLPKKPLPASATLSKAAISSGVHSDHHLTSTPRARASCQSPMLTNTPWAERARR